MGLSLETPICWVKLIWVFKWLKPKILNYVNKLVIVVKE
jgi:hypothetical protein